MSYPKHMSASIFMYLKDKVNVVPALF